MVRQDVDGIKCDYLSQKTWQIEHLTVSSEFCSGNLAHAEATDDSCSQLELKTCADCQGTPQQTNYRTWCVSLAPLAVVKSKFPIFSRI